MKAIYLNLDPYLATFAAWLKAGKPGDAPTFNPLPLAVTVPLGETAAIYINGHREGTDPDPSMEYLTVDGQTVGVFCTVASGDTIATEVVPALSAIIPGAHYDVRAVTGNSVSVTAFLADDEGNETPIPFPVLVRREQASGPVDLVDFTPPAAAPSAADIKSALVAAGEAALDGVSLGGAILRPQNAEGQQTNPTLMKLVGDNPPITLDGDSSDMMLSLGSLTNS